MSEFHRLEFEKWIHLMPQIGLGIFFTLFALAVLRTLLMPKKKLRHLESLPLENDEKPRHEN